jgi:hypothetical protein
VPNAVLTFRSTDVLDDETRLTGSFRTTVTAQGPDGSNPGRFEVELLPGTYGVTVEGSSEQGLGVVREMVRIAPPAEGDTLRGQIFRVPSQSRLGGRVLAPRPQGGEPAAVEGATVRARALGWAPMGGVSEAARFNRDSDAVTDSTGRFSLRADVGSYDLSIRPPSESGYPWIVRPGWSVGSSERSLADTFELTASLPVTGTVRSASGQPIEGAEIKAFALIERDEGQTRTVQIGRTVTRSDGGYRLRLPPEL